jgi:hypothetical protein
MFEHLQALRIRVKAAVAAFFGETAGDEATRAYKSRAQQANREIGFFNEHWRELHEAERFLDATDRARGDNFSGFVGPDMKGK